MTTRLQRERAIPVEEVDSRIDDEFVNHVWREARPKQPMPADFPRHCRSCVRAYLEEVSRPSQGELSLALRRLYDRLIPAIESHDMEPAARALEQTPSHVLAEFCRRSPSKIPSADDLRQAGRGIDFAKDLLGMCISGAEIVPGRRRPNGKRSRPRLKVLPRYNQSRGYPRQQAEMMLVRSLGEFFYNRNGKFPGLTSHGGRFAPDAGPFAHIVASILNRCGVYGIDPIKLVRRCLAELPKADTLSPKKGPVGDRA
jgi:hypothetical protein